VARAGRDVRSSLRKAHDPSRAKWFEFRPSLRVAIGTIRLASLVKFPRRTDARGGTTNRWMLREPIARKGIGDVLAMRVSYDAIASLFMGGCCVALLAAFRCKGGRREYRRVRQQGATFFLGADLMSAGYWALQPIVRYCSAANITPATITWCSLVPALAATVSLLAGHWGGAAWCLLGSALLDVLDGAVARARGDTSVAGAVLDSALDRYAELIFFVGVFVFYRDHLIAQLTALAALFGSFLISYSSAKAEAVRVSPPRGPMKRSDRLTLLILGAALVPVMAMFSRHDDRLAEPFLAAVALIALLANFSAVQRFRALHRSAQASVAARAAEVRLSVAANARESAAGLRH
jgi:CDP-diacylglycerol---glycerol-3-phosphate 3-phosphatidyltransferase